MAREFQIPLVFVDNVAIEKSCRKIVMGPDKPSHNKVLWERSTSATHLLRKARVFEMGLEDAGTT
jgi:hypothetical protein